MHKAIEILLAFIIIFALIFIFQRQWQNNSLNPITENFSGFEDKGEIADSSYPLSIEYMRVQEYPGSEITIEQTLPAGANYSRYIASYKSDGLKIYALLTIPNNDPPATGWSVIIFNHGYIPPKEYRTTEKYTAYTDAFSRQGYIVLKPDYRGHGNSEGEASGGYGSPAYTIDILNAVSSIKRLKIPSTSSGQLANPNKIGMWGHSMGGHITLRSMIVSKDIKAGVIWAGVVASYPDLLNRWRRPSVTSIPLPGGARRWREVLIQQFGTPQENSIFWNSISPNSFLKDISGPIQLHHGTLDASVPLEFSEKLDKELKEAGKQSEFFVYPGDDHNLTSNFNTAIQRSVEFFDKYLK